MDAFLSSTNFIVLICTGSKMQFENENQENYTIPVLHTNLDFLFENSFSESKVNIIS